MSNSDYLDQDALDALNEVTGDDPEFLAELVDTFLEDAPILMAELKQAIADNNTSEVQRLAHSLKGNGREFGATDFAALCEKLEHHAAENDLNDAASLLSSIEDEFPRVQNALQSYIND